MISIMYLKLSDHLSYMELIGVTDSPNGLSVNDQLAFSICVFVCVCVCVCMCPGDLCGSKTQQDLCPVADPPAAGHSPGGCGQERDQFNAPVCPHLINTDMAVSLADFTAFFQDEGKSIKRGENHHKSGHVEKCSYSKGELSWPHTRGFQILTNFKIMGDHRHKDSFN